MSAQTTIWVCLALTAAIFIIDTLSVITRKRAVLKKLNWESGN